MVLMQHQFGYTTSEGSAKTLISEMAVTGKDPLMTAMALGVGYPLGIAAKLIGQGKIGQLGVQIPVHSEYYLPILAELEQLGIVFIDYEV
jgi:saccharopine dehydrogenase (NADP+, L-glutamate forming)